MSDPELLVCYDGSDDSKQAIARAARLFPGRTAIVLHVWEPLKDVASIPPVPGLHAMLAEGLAEMDKEGEDVSRKTAAEGAELANAAGLKAEPLSVQAPGRAWRNILKLADEHDVQAIVLGQRGVGRAERLLMGSVSSAVVNRADRPVVIVPAEE
jgi:nucleotide-binding universal stress UspA family protein